jgi:hypothetical protein
MLMKVTNVNKLQANLLHIPNYTLIISLFILTNSPIIEDTSMVKSKNSPGINRKYASVRVAREKRKNPYLSFRQGSSTCYKSVSLLYGFLISNHNKSSIITLYWDIG